MAAPTVETLPMQPVQLRPIALTRALALLLATLALPTAQAQDNVFKVGVVRYDTHSKTNGVTGIGIPAGADTTVGGASTVLFVGERLFGPHWGVELVLGVPPRITAKASGSVAFLGEVLSARNVAPTVMVNYHFGDPSDPLRPYVGAGLNYTRFTSVRSPYAWDVSLSDSIGPALGVGIELTVARPWIFWASATAVKVKSDLVAVGNTVLQTTIDFRPMVYAMGVAYRF